MNQLSMHQGADSVEELLKVVGRLGKEMKEFGDCDNGIKEIVITLGEDDGSFSIISD
jgi:hypothetical protein